MLGKNDRDYLGGLRLRSRLSRNATVQEGARQPPTLPAPLPNIANLYHNSGTLLTQSPQIVKTSFKLAAVYELVVNKWLKKWGRRILFELLANGVLLLHHQSVEVVILVFNEKRSKKSAHEAVDLGKFDLLKPFFFSVVVFRRYPIVVLCDSFVTSILFTLYF